MTLFTQYSRWCGGSQGTYLGYEVQRIPVEAAIANPTLPVGTGWCARQVGDLDRDGLVDFFDLNGFNIRPWYSKLYLRSASGVQEQIVLPAVDGRQFRLYAFSGDVNGDGVLDLIAPVSIVTGEPPNTVATPQIHTYLGPIPVLDSDGDGVIDSLDSGAGAFTDTIDGQPSTVGAITTIPAGVTVLVSDATDPDGVEVNVGGAGTSPAVLTVCGYKVKLLPGSDVVFTCGSLRSKVITGGAQVFVDDTSSISVSAGSTVTVNTVGGVVSVTSQAGNPPVVDDRTPPRITVPEPVVVEATGAAGVTATFSAVASDLIDGQVSVSCAPTSGSQFPIGQSTVVCSATDAAANTASASIQVIVQDSTAPTVALSTQHATVTSPSSSLLTATATDAVGVSRVEFYEGSTLLATDSAAPFTHSVAFTALENGTHTYRSLAFDAAGNSTWSEQTSVLVNIPVGPQSDLAVSLDVLPTPFRQRATAGYVVVVRNNGAAATTKPVVLTDVLPVGLSYSAVVAPGWNCQVTGATLTCTAATSLGAGKSVGLVVLAQIGATVPIGSSITNSVTVTPSDATPLDNVASRTVTVRK